jgi:suppressor of G2 allele of SKP1
MQEIEAQLKRASTWMAEAAAAAKPHGAGRDRKAEATALGGAVRVTTRALAGMLVAQAAAELYEDHVPAARALAARAVTVDPQSGRAHFLVGRVEMRDGHVDAARRSFSAALDLEKTVEDKKECADWLTRAGGRHAPEEADADVEGVDVSCGGPAVAPEVAAAEREEAPLMPPPPPAGPRMEWYQSPATVTVDFYAKGVDEVASTVVISERRLAVRLVRPGSEPFELVRDLFDDVVVADSSWSATKFKVEVKLRKAAGGEWKTLGAAATGAGASSPDLSAAERARIVGEEKVKAAASAQKDWDAIADKELEGDKDNDGPMALFKTIYADADDDTRRAMMKSYQESGGKVLSTDWKDVGSRKVEYTGKD